jgi:hypothetical protein
VCVCARACVSQRLDVCHINYILNTQGSENYGNNIRGIPKLKILFSQALNFLLLGISFLFLPFPIFYKILNVRCVNPVSIDSFFYVILINKSLQNRYASKSHICLYISSCTCDKTLSLFIAFLHATTKQRKY